jgi:hypothetical protein
MNLARQLQDTFRGRCLAGIHVGEDAYISVIG